MSDATSFPSVLGSHASAITYLRGAGSTLEIIDDGADFIVATIKTPHGAVTFGLTDEQWDVLFAKVHAARAKRDAR